MLFRTMAEKTIKKFSSIIFLLKMMYYKYGFRYINNENNQNVDPNKKNENS